MLEAARVLVADPSVRLVAPVVFLFDGGEETFSQAAHGFMQKYDKPLGVFMNLESTGPGGPDYVFQQTGKLYFESQHLDQAACLCVKTCTCLQACRQWSWHQIHP